MISLSRLESILDEFPKLTIGLIGDLFLDRYLEIEPGLHELSIETGLEAYQVARVRNSPGALGTVMNNLAALGVGRLTPVTVLGDDGHGDDLLRELRRLPADQTHILRDPQRLTPTYTKPLKPDAAGRWQELHRLDVRSREPLSEQTTARLCQELRSAFDRADGWIVLDQVAEANFGVVNDRVRDLLDELARRHPQKLILVDSRAHLGRFSCGILKGNRSEVLAAAGVAQGADQPPQQAAELLARRTGKPAYATLGGEGILIARPDGSIARAPARVVDGPIDIVGAGDSATSGIVAALLSGASELEAAQVGNLVASITIQQLGSTGTATAEQVLAARRVKTRGSRGAG